MTSSIPDGISFSELQSLASNAAPDVKSDVEPESSDLTFGDDKINKEQLLELVDSFCELSMTSCNDPMIHKLMMLRILSNFVSWHTNVGDMLIADGDKDTAVSWLRDAGKFQAAIAIVTSINVGNNDFVTPPSEDDDDND